MNSKNTIEQELNSIRADFYEKTKHMTASQRRAFIKEQTAPINEKYGFKTIARAGMEEPMHTPV